MQRWTWLQVRKIFVWEKRFWFCAKVRHFTLNVWLIQRGFESSFSSFHSVLAGGEGEITWQKDDEDIDEEKVTKVDESSSKLIIKQATMEDAGIYTCHCEFNNGHIDQTSMQLYVFGMWSLNTELQFLALQLGKRLKLLLFCQTDSHLASLRPTMSFWRAQREWCLAWRPASLQWMLSG